MFQLPSITITSVATTTTMLISIIILLRLRNNTNNKPITNNIQQKSTDKTKCRLIFLGTGCSSGTPLVGCLLGLFPGKPLGCAVCRSAIQNRHDKNNRNNPSLLIQSPVLLLPKQNQSVTTSIIEDRFNLVVDVGKTFAESALRFFEEFQVQGVDAVLITHEHADAILGLDELRLVHRLKQPIITKSSEKNGSGILPKYLPEALVAEQLSQIHDIVQKASLSSHSLFNTTTTTPLPISPSNKNSPSNNSGQPKPHPFVDNMRECIVYASTSARKYIANAFPYLFLFDNNVEQQQQQQHQSTTVSSSSKTDNKPTKSSPPSRFVAKLKFHEFKLNLSSPFAIKGFFGNNSDTNDSNDLIITPLPVEHGHDFLSAGFYWGQKPWRFAYISDVSFIPSETMTFLQQQGVDILIIDTLRPFYVDRSRPLVHFDLTDALDTVFLLKPRNCYLVGMGHEFDHDKSNEILSKLPQEKYGIVQLAYDGLCIEFDCKGNSNNNT
jgi:phosphoribosyl 1,2-cyclic phosphodiesterase